MRLALALASAIVATLIVAALAWLASIFDLDIGLGVWIAFALLLAGYLESRAES